VDEWIGCAVHLAQVRMDPTFREDDPAGATGSA